MKTQTRTSTQEQMGTAGKTAQLNKRKDKFRIDWESHLRDFDRLLFNLSEEQKQDYESWFIEGRRLIAFATSNLKEDN